MAFFAAASALVRDAVHDAADPAQAVVESPDAEDSAVAVVDMPHNKRSRLEYSAPSIRSDPMSTAHAL